MDDPAHSQAERDAALLNGTLGIQDAAGVVEAVIRRRHVDAVAGDARRVVLLGGGGDLGGEGGQQADQRLLGGVGQHAGVHGVRALKLHALALELFQHRADARVGVLHIVDRVLAVVAHGQVQVKVQRGRALALVEEEPRGINGHLVQQVGQGDGLAGTLAHAHGLAVAHQVDHLHQHDVQTAAVQPDSVHRALHAGDVAVVVGTPDVDGLVKAAHGQLVVVVGNVGGKIGRDAVGADEHLVLGLLLAAVVGLALVDDAVLGGVLGAAVHDRAVLGLIARAGLQQLVHHGLDCAGAVQVALVEPDVVLDAILAEIALQTRDVLGQGVGNDGLFQLVKVLVDVSVAVDLGKLLGAGDDVRALVALLGQRAGVLALVQLQIADGQALAELLDLVARVVDVELAGHVVAGPVQAGGQAVAQCAAAGVAHVHGAGGVGGDELDVILLACARVGAAIFGVGDSGAHDAGEPVLAQEQVDEAGAGDLNAVKQAAVQLQFCGNGLCDLARCLVEGARTGHSHVGRNIAVFDVSRDLDDEVGQCGLGQGAVGDSRLDGVGQQRARLCQRRRPRVVVFIIHDEPPVGDFLLQ